MSLIQMARTIIGLYFNMMFDVNEFRVNVWAAITDQ